MNPYQQQGPPGGYPMYPPPYGSQPPPQMPPMPQMPYGMQPPPQSQPPNFPPQRPPMMGGGGGFPPPPMPPMAGLQAGLQSRPPPIMPPMPMRPGSGSGFPPPPMPMGMQQQQPGGAGVGTGANASPVMPMVGVQLTGPAAVPIPSPSDKLTTVFIGGIPDGVTDVWIERILRTCGGIKSWKRVTDAQGKPKGFGFCVYETAESVLRCLRILGGEGPDKEPLTLPALTGPHANKESGKKKLIVKVDAVARKHVDEYVDSSSAAAAAVGSESRNATIKEEVLKIVDSMQGSQADAFLGTVVGGPGTINGSNGVVFGVSGEVLVAPGGRSLDDLPEEMPPEEREKLTKEISMFRQRTAAKDREKKERESEIAEERRRREEMQREREKERERERRERESLRGAAVQQTKRRGSLFEEVDEEEERRKAERRERESQQAFVEREMRFERQEAQRLRNLANDKRKVVESEEKRLRDYEAMKLALMEYDDDLEMEHEDFYPEQEELAKAAEEERRLQEAREAELRQQDELRLKEDEEKIRLERVAKEREEERKERSRQVYQPTTASGVVVGRIMTVEERKAAIESLVNGLPSDREGLCGWIVKWHFLDEYVMSNKIRPFVTKKVVEFLGGEEGDLIEFVMSLIKKKVGAAKMITELEGALAEDAEIFVLKLWRMVIFE
ncbi:hypothetical protein HDU76_004058, partial [Blyttiomyces sp. JEL0837]